MWSKFCANHSKVQLWHWVKIEVTHSPYQGFSSSAPAIRGHSNNAYTFWLILDSLPRVTFGPYPIPAWWHNIFIFDCVFTRQNFVVKLPRKVEDFITALFVVKLPRKVEDVITAQNLAIKNATWFIWVKPQMPLCDICWHCHDLPPPPQVSHIIWTDPNYLRLISSNLNGVLGSFPFNEEVRVTVVCV